MPNANTDLVQVRDLIKYFSTGRKGQIVKAVDGVSFSIERGTTFGLVGESGCGKSTIARLLLRLIDADGGSVTIDGTNVHTATRREVHRLRRNMQMIFQDPFSSLNPRMSVYETLREPLRVHGMHKGHERNRIGKLLDMVGLPQSHISRLPHEFSGGQRQRICIARALALQPALIVCDEAVSALDVSIQSQILNLLKDIQAELSVTYLFISHNLGVIKYISDTIGVMYLGRMVECAPKNDLFARPNHPYTQALLASVPAAAPGHKRQRIVLDGDLPSPIDPPHGCRFHTRCPEQLPICQSQQPSMFTVGAHHISACHLNQGAIKIPSPLNS